jgi:hypothetical protein
MKTVGQLFRLATRAPFPVGRPRFSPMFYIIMRLYGARVASYSVCRSVWCQKWRLAVIHQAKEQRAGQHGNASILKQYSFTSKSWISGFVLH